MNTYTRKRLALPVAALLIFVVCVGATAPKSGDAGLSAATKEAVAQAYSLLLKSFYRPITARTLELGAVEGIDKYARIRNKSAALTEAPHQAGAAYIERLIADGAQKTGLPKTDIAYAALAGMAAAARDRWTMFLTPKELEQFNTALSPQKFFGIGVLLATDRKTSLAKALFVVPGGPADAAGLQTGDFISAINGSSTKGLSQSNVSNMLRGPRGTSIQIATSSPSGTERTVSITRDSVQPPTVIFDVLPNTSIGYIYVTVFGRATADEFTEALTRLKQRHITSLVLDLRDDGGGYVQAAVSIASHFISTGPIVSTIARDGNVITFASDDAAPQVDVPATVLVNGYTASASEITAGALQDSNAATIVGTRTFGKGVEQTLSYLPDGSAIKITTARYLTPNNRDLNGVGLQPDRSCPIDKSAQRNLLVIDPQLQCALTYLKPQ